jgi:hypothetical protein
MDEATDSSQKLNNPPPQSAKSSNRILRLIAVRSFLALTNHRQKLSTTILAQHENAPCQHNSNPFN